MTGPAHGSVSLTANKKRLFYTRRDFREQGPVGGEGILNQLTAESGAGPGAKRSYGSVCSPRRKGGELNSFTLPGLLPLGRTPGGPSVGLAGCPGWAGSGGTGAGRPAFAAVLLVFL